jgi:LmbE family N-acetylglucosaminyl deacetylase
VYAHPDDETIYMGGTLARYAREGVRVVCVTATRGEVGEIVDPALDSPDNRRLLGELRMAEMELALASLGPIESRWLGYLDSGVAGDPRNADPMAFCRADVQDVAGRIARIIREVRPQVVLTLPDGNDEHPDHAHAAVATRIACELAGDPTAWPEQLNGDGHLQSWSPSRVYHACGQSRTPLTTSAKLRFAIRDRGPVGALYIVASALLRRLRPAGDQAAQGSGIRPRPRPQATARIDIVPWVDARDRALRAYRTQIAPDDELLELAPKQLRRLRPMEEFTERLSGTVTPLADDLFSGVECGPTPKRDRP